MKSNKVVSLLKDLGLLLYAMFALFPLVWLVIISFKHDREMFNTTFIFSPTLDNYRVLFSSGEFIGYFVDNLIVSVGAIILSIVVGVPAAYALARFDFKGKESIAFTFLSFRFAPEILVVLPIFLIYQKIGLYDTYFGLIWIFQVVSLPLMIWILRGYFEDISVEMEHAARLDGYSWWQVFIKMIIPLIKPGLVASSLLSFIFVWNNFTFSLLLAGQKVTTTTVAMLKYVSSDTVHYGQMAAAVLISSLPIIILALAIQKHLVRGLSMGAVKG
ncbi:MULTISPECIES: carbohydrate ABC transporter permease [Parageobacillus]|uniref:Carbohydrate ABC transporter membrane protein 2, CUT1 family n=2 Tax=Anoxybacillaceae TaxID=3120669 RepID=A0A1I0T4S9_9BACL|nr:MULTISPECIES: carbohydrate ABC transporter permease [Parageobacillus]OUM93960.1 MAG: sugar ABC transporter permease [Parageobacillus thermoglucosidasius]SFA46798.1 carbohydrate ABC transporter membrane protein 2, CUT1 family [Parageobacillus thermantarcticus]